LIPKSKKGFEFWTFLKMSILGIPKIFFEKMLCVRRLLLYCSVKIKIHKMSVTNRKIECYYPKVANLANKNSPLDKKYD
jgi:hypothetical protein